MKATELTRAQLAGQLRLSPGRISQLVKEGHITQLPNGKYSPEAVQQYIEFIRERTAPKSEYSDLLLQEKLRELKRENDEAEKLYAPREVLEHVLELEKKAIIRILDTLPAMVKAAVPELGDDCIELVRQETIKCQEIARSMTLDMAND